MQQCIEGRAVVVEGSSGQRRAREELPCEALNRQCAESGPREKRCGIHAAVVIISVVYVSCVCKVYAAGHSTDGLTCGESCWSGELALVLTPYVAAELAAINSCNKAKPGSLSLLIAAADAPGALDSSPSSSSLGTIFLSLNGKGDAARSTRGTVEGKI